MSGSILQKENAIQVLQNDNGSSISNGAGAAVGTTLDNRSGGTTGAQAFFADFELKGAFGSNPGAAKSIDVYLVPTLDGANAADVDSSIPQAQYFVGSIQTVNSASSKRLCLNKVPIAPLLYTVYLVNNTGQTLSANWGFRVVLSQEQYT